MSDFNTLNLSKQLFNAIDDLGFSELTEIQEKSFPIIMSGRDVVGIAQTGTGKTLAYCLPLLQNLDFSTQINPRVLIIVPTRELVVQVAENLKDYAKYKSHRITGVYGGVNINTQARDVAQGCDILVATPGRLYDMVMMRAVRFKAVNKLVIDEVDLMLDLGFRPQLKNLFDLLPQRKQNIMFSATMTEEVEELINTFFTEPENILIAPSGKPLAAITQTTYPVKNFYTKIKLLSALLKNQEEFSKVIVFVSTKKNADILFDKIQSYGISSVGIIHSNKSQNYRLDIVENFDNGHLRILIATDIIARGLDFDKLSHVISIDTPTFPENYIHRIGRAGRAGEKGKSILFYTDDEEKQKIAIENLMEHKITTLPFPEEVSEDTQLLDEERIVPRTNQNRKTTVKKLGGEAFHEKKEKNSKENQGGSYRRELAKKYKKPYTKGDKIGNRKNKR